LTSLAGELGSQRKFSREREKRRGWLSARTESFSDLVGLIFLQTTGAKDNKKKGGRGKKTRHTAERDTNKEGTEKKEIFVFRDWRRKSRSTCGQVYGEGRVVRVPWCVGEIKGEKKGEREERFLSQGSPPNGQGSGRRDPARG